LDPARAYECASLMARAAEELRRAAERARELCGEKRWVRDALGSATISTTMQRILEKLERGEPLEEYELHMISECEEGAASLKSHAQRVEGLARLCRGRG